MPVPQFPQNPVHIHSQIFLSFSANISAKNDDNNYVHLSGRGGTEFELPKYVDCAHLRWQ